MKTLLTVLGIVLLIGFMAYPAFSDSHGWNWGRHMMGTWDRDCRHGHMHDPGYGNLRDAERGKLEELERQYYQETEGIRNQIMNKSEEPDELMDSQNPDLERARAIQRDISELRAELDQKDFDYELEARKIIPESRFGSGYVRGYHRGYWGHDQDMGYGPGACWR